MPDLPSRKVVVITGAGASVGLGRDDAPLPMMSGWSESLYADLNELMPGVADLIGLIPQGIDGAVFEEKLGAYLAFEQAMPQIEHFRSMGNPGGPATGDSQTNQWYQYVADRTNQVSERIRRNLFTNFGYRRIDRGKANSAYDALLTWLTPTGPTTPRFAIVTTNYDQAVEVAFRDPVAGRKFNVLDGFEPNPYASPELDAEGIAHQWLQDEGSLALLHLHGAVGWYRDDTTKNIQRQPGNRPYDPSLGTAALLLPDPTKNIASLAGAEALWNEFRALLGEASHVVVLGHSLHDPHLVDFLKEHLGERRPAVLAYLPADQIRTGAVPSEQEVIQRVLPTAIVVPCDFGPHPSVDEESLKRWAAEQDMRKRVNVDTSL